MVKKATRGPYKTAGNKIALKRKQDFRRNFVREWMDIREIGVEELAQRAKLSIASISIIRNQTGSFSAQSLEKICLALGVTRGMALDIDPSKAPEMWRNWFQASPEERRRIAAVHIILQDEGLLERTIEPLQQITRQ